MIKANAIWEDEADLTKTVLLQQTLVEQKPVAAALHTPMLKPSADS